jgi:hypothetical protein
MTKKAKQPIKKAPPPKPVQKRAAFQTAMYNARQRRLTVIKKGGF